MAKKLKTLVQFNTDYYKYPNTVPHGYRVNYPIEKKLTMSEQKDRDLQLKAIIKRTLSEFHTIVKDGFIDTSDTEKLLMHQKQHGIFAEKFFYQSIRPRITRKFAELALKVEAFQEIYSKAIGYTFKLHNNWDAIDRIMEHIFQQTLLELDTNSEFCQQLLEWFNIFKVPRNCTLCGNLFRVIDIPYWIYFGANGFKDCCFQCQIVETPREKELSALLPDFINACGFVPTSSANPINFSFTSRLSNEQWAKAILGYAKIGTIEHVKKKFGSWFEALVQTRTLPNGVQITGRGIRCLAQDGHVCHSLDEQRIDDWLFSHSIPHEREPSYPIHTELNPLGRKLADWKVYDAFIEYFGLIGDSAYEKRMNEKIMLAQNCGIELIELYPSDIQRIDEVLEERLNHN